MLVEKKEYFVHCYGSSRRLYAMKIVKKAQLEHRNQKIHAMNEREIMEIINHPFLVQLHYAF
jgi:serine/threonine protein kinase